MKGPYGFEVNDNCQTCKLRADGFFCQLPPAALKDLNAIKFMSAYPEKAVLFMEKQATRGIYLLCEGEMKLSVSSSEGKTLILRIARPGEVLGLTAALAGTPHEVTAEALRPAQVAFVRRDEFLRFIARHPEAYPIIAQQLGAQYQTACEQLRNVGLSTSMQERLARFLLEFSAAGQETKQGTRIKLPLSHQEIGELIGTTRETVTRTLSEFRSQNLVMIQGSTLLIQNRPALENLVAA
jgi:CRP/FNR family transcriptional regulator, cyclic AMP receptor protein